jgi:non-canonical (house-cleaning) NTP pyrophosphatase
MIVGIGTQNSPKVNACKNVLTAFRSKFLWDSEPEYYILPVETGISAMPISIDEMMDGASRRAVVLYALLREKNISADLTIGLEGGLFLKYIREQITPVTFLQSWVYAYNGITGNWGSSGAVTVPWKIAEPVIMQHEELATVIDRFAGGKNIRNTTGAVGILTENETVRQDLFETALKFALAPFYNSKIYS